MKHLYLFRHAEAGEHAPGTRDEMRELTARGREQASIMGDLIKRENIHPDAVFCSNAIRARQTLMIAIPSNSFESPKIFYRQDLYNASAGGLLETIRAFHDAYDHVMLVGHNPSLSYLAAHLTGCPSNLSTAAIVAIELQIAQWQTVKEGTGTLLRQYHAEINQKKESLK